MKIFSRRPQDTRHQLEPGTLDGIGWENATRDCLLSDHLGESPGGGGGAGRGEGAGDALFGVTRRRVGEGVGAACLTALCSSINSAEVQGHVSTRPSTDPNVARGDSDGENKWASGLGAT